LARCREQQTPDAACTGRNCYRFLTRLRFLYFGRLREFLAPDLFVELAAPACVADFWRCLCQQHTPLAAG
jgi:hypothetical protein